MGMKQWLATHGIFAMCLFMITGLLLYYGYHNEMCEGGADNIWHYYFSHYAYTYPDFFLHHWGKPLFILLSSPFSHFGFYATKVFNILCGVLATLVCYMWLGRMRVRARWLIAPVLLFMPMYFIMLQSTLTEPLFSLVLISAAYLFFREKYVAGAIVLSFLMFARSEGSFITVYFMVWLLFQRQWKAIPFLFTGFLIYAVVGQLAGHGFWWFFTENPYRYESPYGHGHWLDILGRYAYIWGIAFTILLVASVLVVLVLCTRQKSYLLWKPLTVEGKLLYLALLPALLFTAFHLVVWHLGLCGSAGLDRVIASVLPCYALLGMWGLSHIVLKRFPIGFSSLLTLLFLICHIRAPFKVYQYPLKAYAGDRVEMLAADWFKTVMPDKYVLYYAHPNIVFNLGRDPFDKSMNIEEFAFSRECQFDKSLPVYAFWDSSFSESACHLSRADIEACGFEKIREFSDPDFTLAIYKLKAN